MFSILLLHTVVLNAWLKSENEITPQANITPAKDSAKNLKVIQTKLMVEDSLKAANFINQKNTATR